MKTFYIYLTALFAVPALLLAQDIEEVTVSSAFLDGDVSNINNPIHVIQYSDFSKKGVSTLAESIDTLLGVSNQDYGASVGQPIIRGMSGNRVKVLNNGLVVRDVAFMGADHPIEVDIGGIQQIEIVKGPSSILYSNGAIGGIVNIVDNTIAKEDVLANVFNVGFESQSVNDGDNFNINYSGAVEGFNLFFSHSSKNLDNFDIPDEAVNHEPGETHEEFSYLPNSDSKLAATRLGISKTGDWGYYGISSVIIDQLQWSSFSRRRRRSNKRRT
ncbi:MAG: TonB-dependent receptor plug domain-containing protein [Gammaproteobacteria bacterium]